MIRLKQFGSWGDFTQKAGCVPLDASYRTDNSPYRMNFSGGLTYAHTLDVALTGDDSLVPRAQMLLDRIHDVSEGIPTREWTPSPWGAYPVVPEYLAGFPACMRAQEPSGDVSPVRIFASIAISQSITPEVALNRGVAILALVMKLQAVRQVDLFLTAEIGSSSNGIVYSIPIESRPLSLSHACFGLANVAVLRRLVFALAVEDVIAKFRDVDLLANHAELNQIKGTLGVTAGDLYIPSATSASGRDSHFNNDSDVVSWVNDMVSKYGTVRD